MFASKKMSLLIIMHLFASISAIPTVLPHENKNLSMPKECANQNYCKHKHELYPTKTIEDLFKISKQKMKYRNEMSQEYTENDDICERTKEHVTIYEIIDVNGAMRFVAQTSDTVQSYDVEIVKCKYPGILTGSAPFIPEQEIDTKNYTLLCEDITSELVFLVLSQDGKSLEPVKSKAIPVGCSCRYRSKLQGVQDH